MEARDLGLSEVVHLKGCSCDRCEAIREFGEEPTVEIPRETMDRVVAEGRE